MPITVRWMDNSQVLLRYDFIGRWTWQECERAVEQAKVLIGQVRHPVYVWVDMRENEHIPVGDLLIHLRRFTISSNTNWGGGVILGTSNTIKTIFSLFQRIYPPLGRRFHLVDNDQQAQEALNVMQQKG